MELLAVSDSDLSSTDSESDSEFVLDPVSASRTRKVPCPYASKEGVCACRGKPNKRSLPRVANVADADKQWFDAETAGFPASEEPDTWAESLQKILSTVGRCSRSCTECPSVCRKCAVRLVPRLLAVLSKVAAFGSYKGPLPPVLQHAVFEKTLPDLLLALDLLEDGLPGQALPSDSAEITLPPFKAEDRVRVLQNTVPTDAILQMDFPEAPSYILSSDVLDTYAIGVHPSVVEQLKPEQPAAGAGSAGGSSSGAGGAGAPADGARNLAEEICMFMTMPQEGKCFGRLGLDLREILEICHGLLLLETKVSSPTRVLCLIESVLRCAHKVLSGVVVLTEARGRHMEFFVQVTHTVHFLQALSSKSPAAFRDDRLSGPLNLAWGVLWLGTAYFVQPPMTRPRVIADIPSNPNMITAAEDVLEKLRHGIEREKKDMQEMLTDPSIARRLRCAARLRQAVMHFGFVDPALGQTFGTTLQLAWEFAEEAQIILDDMEDMEDGSKHTAPLRDLTTLLQVANRRYRMYA